MTFLQPKKDRNFLVRLVLASIIPFVGGVFGLVILYNQVVSFEHEILKTDKEIEEAQAATAELKEQIFAFFGSDSVERLTSERGLVQDKNPEYFEDSIQWAFASQ